ncbi:nnp-1 protein putative nuclear protein 1 nop52 [Anaeramoeba flamelloides]|uniref:Nnp-1 protein putative nuclear protein 1 nop52 n=1 Tax=Anaeramoeba flamelloides TaxID=1746091 RepID=A0ABQ8X0J8_9EUKA|nr:nnp-1 protein putative nuclear protein 1 nop52 [Anaeramoeba flamelloides]
MSSSENKKSSSSNEETQPPPSDSGETSKSTLYSSDEEGSNQSQNSNSSEKEESNHEIKKSSSERESQSESGSVSDIKIQENDPNSGSGGSNSNSRSNKKVETITKSNSESSSERNLNLNKQGTTSEESSDEQNENKFSIQALDGSDQEVDGNKEKKKQKKKKKNQQQSRERNRPISNYYLKDSFYQVTKEGNMNLHAQNSVIDLVKRYINKIKKEKRKEKEKEKKKEEDKEEEEEEEEQKEREREKEKENLKNQKIKSNGTNGLSSKLPLESEFELLIFLNIYTNWKGIDLFLLNRSYSEIFKRFKKVYERGWYLARKWACLKTFQFKSEVDRVQKGQWSFCTVYFEKKEFVVVPKKNDETSFKARYGEINFYTSPEKKNLILIQNNETLDKLAIRLCSIELRCALLFLLLLYNSTKGKDYRIGKNPQVSHLDLDRIDITVLPLLKKPKKMQPDSYTFQKLKQEYTEYFEMARIRQKKKTQNLSKAFLQQQAFEIMGTTLNKNKKIAKQKTKIKTTTTTKNYKNLNHKSNKQNNDEKKKRNYRSTKSKQNKEKNKNFNNSFSMVSHKHSSQPLLESKRKTSISSLLDLRKTTKYRKNRGLSPIIGSSIDLLNIKDKESFEILQKKNYELFDKQKFSHIEWDFFSDFGPRRIYQKGIGVFFLYVLTKHLYPFDPGYIILEKDGLKVNSRKVKLKILFTLNFQVLALKHHNQLCKIQSRGKKKKLNNTIFLLATNNKNRDLIVRTINFFYRSWFKNLQKKKKN